MPPSKVVTPVTPTPVTPTPVPIQPIQPLHPNQAGHGTPKPAAPTPVTVQPITTGPVPVRGTPLPVDPKTAGRQPVTPVSVGTGPVSPVPVQPAVPGKASVSSRPILIKPPNEDDELAMLGKETPSNSEEDEDVEADVKRLARSAPPWMVSTIVHILIILIAGLVLRFGTTKKAPTEFEATFAEVEGEQLDDALDFSEEDIEFEDDALLDEVVLDPVVDPLSAPMDMIADLNPVGMSPTFTAPTVGAALNGRTPGKKAGLLKAYGGTDTTEAAVANGLEWLKKNIVKSTGGWSLKGPYTDHGSAENPVAATAMAVLAFQGAGHTTKEGKYQAELRRAWKYLLSRQDSTGQFKLIEQTPYMHTFYTQAQASIALCELYALTQDPELKEPAQRAIDFLVKTQGDKGGWRYVAKAESDLSVTGWGVMALQSARMAGIEVPAPAFDKLSIFLDSVASEENSRYRYIVSDIPNPTMTAEGLLCRQYLGWSHDEPALIAGTQYLSENPIQWREPDHYYWYYATQVLHHMEGDAWEKWNEVMRQEIPSHQVKSGREAGSWYDENDRWAIHGGRIYTTCLSLFMLEVYYRHLPLYNSMYSTDR